MRDHQYYFSSRPLGMRLFFFAVVLLSFPLAAFAIDNEQISYGSACSGSGNGVDWDTIYQCNSSVWQRSPYFFGDSSATCSSTYAGQMRWRGKLQGCDGSVWGFSFPTSTPTPKITIYTANGTWTPGSGNNVVRVSCIGGGGGGGGGYKSSTTNAGGGVGGNGSSFVSAIMPISSLSTPVTITIGSGGTGGAGASVVGGGSTGGTGGTTTFGSYLTAVGATGGATGAASSTTTSSANGNFYCLAGTGGGTGGYNNSGSTTAGWYPSSASGTCSAQYINTFISGGAGATGSNTAENGIFFGGPAYLSFGGGGASEANTNVAGGTGGAGGYGSGGGGGGGCGTSCTLSAGTGGAGGGGYCVVAEW